jgi:hypothetical protein
MPRAIARRVCIDEPYLGERNTSQQRKGVMRPYRRLMRMHYRPEFRESASETIVMQRARRGRSCDAGDRAEIFVDGP